MDTKQMLKYHLGIPLLLFVVLLVFGAPILTAFFVACMAGCASMMFMMGGHGDAEREDRHESGRREGH